MKHQISTLGGYSLELPDGDRLSYRAANGVPYEHILLQLAAAIVGDGLVIDCGAHAGNHTTYLAKAGASVVAIEPNPQILPFLSRNVADNDLSTRVTIHEVGLWDGASNGTVHAATGANSGATVVEQDSDGHLALVSLDSLALAPDLVKIDVEGAELHVLRGAKRTITTHRPALFIETHEHLTEVSDQLSNWGYRRVGGSWAASPTYLFIARRSQLLRASYFMARRMTFKGVVRSIRSRAQRNRPLARFYRRLRGTPQYALETVRIMKLRTPASRLESSEPSPDLKISEPSPELIVSLTSFPGRIKHAWIAIESILRQDQRPDRVILVLAEEEFPDRKLPRKIRRQQRRGLEVLWTPLNIGSFKKLIPTRLAYPAATIITVDDDLVYKPWLVSALTAAARQYAGSVIGHRGWEVGFDNNGLTPYRSWSPASISSHDSEVLLTGGAGTLYSPGVLPDELLTNSELAIRLCPTADDVWFWAVAKQAGVPIRCVGQASYRAIHRQALTPALEKINLAGGQNQLQLERVIEHFGLDVNAK